MKELLSSLYKIIDARLSNRVDYMAGYPAVVKSQRGDGKVVVKPDDARFPEVAADARTGLPASSFKINEGSRVLLQFDNADPSKPYVSTFLSGGTAQEVEIAAQIVKLGQSATEFAAIASKVDSSISAIVKWANLHAHASDNAPPTLLILPGETTQTASSTIKVSP